MELVLSIQDTLGLSSTVCQVLSSGRSVYKSYNYTIGDCNVYDFSSVERGIHVGLLDLGLCFDEKLSFKEHIHAEIYKAYMMLGVIERNFKYLTIPTFILLYNSMVRSHLDYCSSVWTQYRKGDIEALEKVQKERPKFYQH